MTRKRDRQRQLAREKWERQRRRRTTRSTRRRRRTAVAGVAFGGLVLVAAVVVLVVFVRDGSADALRPPRPTAVVDADPDPVTSPYPVRSLGEADTPPPAPRGRNAR